MEYTTPYTPPTLTVDAVLFRVNSGVLEVLLLKRPNDPFKDWWALPGGYSAKGETTIEALGRVVTQKTGVDIERDVQYIEQLYSFDTVDRDPRGHAVSVTYVGIGHEIDLDSARDERVAFFPVNALPELAYDHASIIAYAKERIAAKLTHTNIASFFLGAQFTLTQLQTVYEAVFLQAFDKRNFRKKFLSLGLIHETADVLKDGAHRPAKLYAFNDSSLTYLDLKF